MNLFLVELITIILLTSPHPVYHICFYILIVDRWFIDASHPLPCTSRCPRKVSRYSTALRPASKATLLSKSGLVKIEMARSKWRHSCWIYIRIYKIYHDYLVGGFNHLEKYEFVNGKDDIPYIMENKSHVPNHQAVIIRSAQDLLECFG